MQGREHFPDTTCTRLLKKEPLMTKWQLRAVVILHTVLQTIQLFCVSQAF